MGLWRWKNLPKSQLNLIKRLGIEPIQVKYGSSDEEKMDVKYTVGASSCQDGSIILEGKFNQGLNLERISNFLSIFGRSMLNLEKGILNIRKNMILINLFSDGSINIRIYDGEESTLIDILEKIFPLILKAQKCIGCGICVEQCPSKAIQIQDQQAWIDVDKCNKCLNCLKKCPILDFSYKEIFKKARS